MQQQDTEFRAQSREKRLEFGKRLVEMRVMAESGLSRTDFMGLVGKTFKGARDIYNVCGYKRDLTFDDFLGVYQRQDIAGRIVDAYPQATWCKPPEIVESDKLDTVFEKQFNALNERLKFFSYLERVDRLSGIGEYGVLLIGLNDGQGLERPVIPGSIKPEDVIYLRAMAENSCQVAELETNISSPRYGRPLFYTIEILDPDGDDTEAVKDVKVHWTRVLHAAEGLSEDEIHGTPRLKKIYNRLEDLEKIAAGTPEMFWQGARMGVQANILPEHAAGDLAGAMGGAFDDLEEELDNYYHGLRRFIRTRGVELKTLGSETPDPKSTFEMLISLISGATGIPQRILMGAERGELASSQDEKNWNARVQERQKNYADPNLLRPLVERLQWYGALPETPNGFQVEWPDLFALDEDQQASVALKRAQAIAALTKEPERFLLPDELREHFANLPPFTDKQIAEMEESMMPESDEDSEEDDFGEDDFEEEEPPKEEE